LPPPAYYYLLFAIADADFFHAYYFFDAHFRHFMPTPAAIFH
jgi:hypothetical protein